MSTLLPELGHDPDAPFPPPPQALRQPDGLLAWGGDLSATRLMNAYRNGIFPWYSPDDPILWWSPDPRTVFDTSALHLSRRFHRQMRSSRWRIRIDHDFSAIITACANTPRPGQHGTWIDTAMQAAYQELHQLGHAHSVAVYDENDDLAGGIYGIHAGPVFCGESMFSHRSGGSKIALAALCRLLAEHQARWLDAQFHTPHLASLGALQIPRARYLEILQSPASSGLGIGSWQHLYHDLRVSDLA